MADGARGRVRIHEGMALTAKQRAVHELKLSGKTRAEIASILGISAPVVSKMVVVINKKLGIRPPGRIGNGGVCATEIKDPEKAAAVIDAITEPDALVKLKQAYEECGLPGKVSDSLVRRLKTKYYGAVTATRNLKASEMAELFSHKIDLAARYMDDKTAGEASFRDLALAATAMAEKRQLLRGEPTQIISDSDRKKLHELLPSIIAEGLRRGITVEGQVMAKEITNVAA